MFKIISTKDLQKKIGKISKEVEKTGFIVTKNGKGKMLLLPYFDGCDEVIEDYIEDYEIHLNKEKLLKKWDDSVKSGVSDFKIEI